MMDKKEKNYANDYFKKFKEYIDKKKKEKFEEDSLDDIISSSKLDD